MGSQITTVGIKRLHDDLGVNTAKLVLLNGNSFKPTAQTITNADGTSTTLIQGPVTTEKNVQKKNDVKARSMLLMALPNEHLMTFNQYKDAQTLFAAIQTRFGGNEATKKTQKTLLKQMNKPDLDTMSFDDLYNNFKIVEQEVKGTSSSSSSLSSQKLAFMSSTSNTNEVNTAYGVSTANTQVSTANDLEEINLKWQLALLSMRTRKFFQKTGRKITINECDTAGYDKSKVECFNYHKLGHFARECKGHRNQDNRSKNQDSSRRTINVEEISSKVMLAIDGAGFDWSFMEDEEPEFDGYGPKTGKSVSEDPFNEVRESPDVPLVEESVSNDKLEKKTVFPTIAKINFVRPQQQEKPVRKPVKYVEMYSFDHMQANCNYHERESVVSGNNYTRVNYNYSAQKAHPTAHRNMAPRAVLMKTGLRPLNTARPVNTAYPKTTVYSQPAVNTARPSPAVVNAVRVNQVNAVKASACKLLLMAWMGRNADIKDGASLADESQVLLKVPRKNNMYSVDMKNSVPKESLTCLVAKATLDESMLWHRRLGHVNFKTMNKLVKDNLVKGLPIKRFENDQTCVACLKGKQHKASYKSKIQNSITQPLFMLHMDLFGPTFVSSLMNKKYCLVVTDDYNRFTWVFSLASKDETSDILKSFITQIENLVDKKVKIIKCDNGTEFKNRVMNEFCEKKGIKREFSVARTHQQNGVAKRRNKILIGAARTMLADFKLHTTFWAEAVNTACYVQNRVLVVKPHNKTPMNSLEFDGKSDDGFFVGYSSNSKAFRVYNIRTRKVEENLHVRFLEDKHILTGDGPKWQFDIDVLTKSMNYVSVVAGTNSNDFVGTKESIGAGHSSKETGSSQDYILMPLWKGGSPFDSSSKDASNDEPQLSNDAGKKDDEGGIDDQERTKNSAQDINTAGPSINTVSTKFDTGSLNINTVSLTVPTAPLESTYAYFFGDESELDLSNIATTYPVPTTPNTRIHKDHSLDHVLGDVQSGVQTRRMINEQGFISVVYEGKTHEDLHTCLFAYFLSQEEPKKVIQALKDPSWIEAMQEELLQFKLQQVWTLVDLPYGKRAIGTK
ncbi:putative ribonuclease H-like domain-containing protein [Tanacetum coccineum]